MTDYYIRCVIGYVVGEDNFRLPNQKIILVVIKFGSHKIRHVTIFLNLNPFEKCGLWLQLKGSSKLESKVKKIDAFRIEIIF